MCLGLGCGVGGLLGGWGGGGAAVFWPIVSSTCTNCWTGSIALVDSCAETGGDGCRVGGVHKLCDGGGGKDGISLWPSKSSITGSLSSRASVLSRTSASSPSILSSPGSLSWYDLLSFLFLPLSVPCPICHLPTPSTLVHLPSVAL